MKHTTTTVWSSVEIVVERCLRTEFKLFVHHLLSTLEAGESLHCEIKKKTN
jgi:hypothetical protein